MTRTNTRQKSTSDLFDVEPKNKDITKEETLKAKPNLTQEIIKVKKPRKPISDERRQILREQLKKGRETSLMKRQENKGKKKIESEKENKYIENLKKEDKMSKEEFKGLFSGDLAHIKEQVNYLIDLKKEKQLRKKVEKEEREKITIPPKPTPPPPKPTPTPPPPKPAPPPPKPAPINIPPKIYVPTVFSTNKKKSRFGF
jgi:hypothetical protein